MRIDLDNMMEFYEKNKERADTDIPVWKQIGDTLRAIAICERLEALTAAVEKIAEPRKCFKCGGSGTVGVKGQSSDTVMTCDGCGGSGCR